MIRDLEIAAGRFLARLVRVENAVTTAAFCALILLVFADVASRELTGAGLHWARQTGVYANIIVVMLGLGLASDAGAHLRPRFADSWLPNSWLPFLVRMQHGLMAVFCLAFAVVALGVVKESYDLGVRSAELMIVIWPIQSVIPLTFTIAFVRHGLYALYPSLAPDDAAAADDSPTARRQAL